MEVPTPQWIISRIESADNVHYMNLLNRCIMAIKAAESRATIAIGLKDKDYTVCQLVMNKLTQSGWRTEVQYDQRDGDFIRILFP